MYREKMCKMRGKDMKIGEMAGGKSEERSSWLEKFEESERLNRTKKQVERDFNEYAWEGIKNGDENIEAKTG